MNSSLYITDLRSTPQHLRRFSFKLECGRVWADGCSVFNELWLLCCDALCLTLLVNQGGPDACRFWFSLVRSLHSSSAFLFHRFDIPITNNYLSSQAAELTEEAVIDLCCIFFFPSLGYRKTIWLLIEAANPVGTSYVYAR